MKPCKVKAVLLKRIAYLEVFLRSTKGNGLAHSTRCCILDEVDALRSVLGKADMLDEKKLDELRRKEMERVFLPPTSAPREERVA